MSIVAKLGLTKEYFQKANLQYFNIKDENDKIEYIKNMKTDPNLPTADEINNYLDAVQEEQVIKMGVELLESLVLMIGTDNFQDCLSRVENYITRHDMENIPLNILACYYHEKLPVNYKDVMYILLDEIISNTTDIVYHRYVFDIISVVLKKWTDALQHSDLMKQFQLIIFAVSRKHNQENHAYTLVNICKCIEEICLWQCEEVGNVFLHNVDQIVLDILFNKEIHLKSMNEEFLHTCNIILSINSLIRNKNYKRYGILWQSCKNIDKLFLSSGITKKCKSHIFFYYYCIYHLDHLDDTRNNKIPIEFVKDTWNSIVNVLYNYSICLPMCICFLTAEYAFYKNYS